MPTCVCCLAASSSQADQIVRVLNDEGFDPRTISVLFPHRQDTDDFATAMHTRMPESVSETVRSGGMLSGPLGWAMGLGALGWLVGVGALMLPGVGPFIAAGPILAALSGTLLGATVGGVAGVLIGFGLPEHDARHYEARIRAGGIFIAVHAQDSEGATRIEQVLTAAGAEDLIHVTEDAVRTIP